MDFFFLIFLQFFPLFSSLEQYENILDHFRHIFPKFENNRLDSPELKQWIQAVNKATSEWPSNENIDTAFYNQFPPSWLFVLPEKNVLYTKSDGNLLAKFLGSQDNNIALVYRISHIIQSSSNETKDTFLRQYKTSDFVPLSSTIPEWWQDNIVHHLTVSKAIKVIAVLPSNFVYGLQNTAFDDTVGSYLNKSLLTDWSQASLGQLCTWKDVLSKYFHILKNIYDVFMEDIDVSELSGMAPFLTCYSPEMISSWLYSNLTVFQNRNPVFKILQHWKELKLNALQVQKLSDSVTWNFPEVDKSSIIHLMDVSKIVWEDIDSKYSFLKEDSVPWPVILKVAKLRNITTNINTVDDAMKLGKLIVLLSPKTLRSLTGTWNIKEIQAVGSPYLRTSQSRTLIRELRNEGPFNQNIFEALSSEQILNVSSLPSEKFNIQKMLPSQHFALFSILSQSSDLYTNYNKLLQYIHPRSEDHNSSLSILPFTRLSTPIALISFSKWFQGLPITQNNVKTSLRNSDLSFLSRIISGLTCTQLKSFSTLDIPIIASFYNHYIFNSPKKLNSYPLGLHVCFKNCMIKYLKMKASLIQEPFYLNQLTRSDIQSFGGLLLSSLSLSEISKIHSSNIKNEIFEAIGAVPLSYLISVLSIDQLSDMGKMALKEFSLRPNEPLSFPIMTRLGTLGYFLPKNFIASDLEEIKTYISNYLDSPLKKLICFPRELRKQWMSIITKTYGYSMFWSSWDLVELGDLLSLFPNTNISFINPTEFRLALPLLLNQSLLFHKYPSFPTFISSVSFYEACSTWLGQDVEYKENIQGLLRRYLGVSQYSVMISQTEEQKITPPPPEHLRSFKAISNELNAINKKIFSTAVSADLLKLFPYISIWKAEKERPKSAAQYLHFQKSLIRELIFALNISALELEWSHSDQELCSLINCVDGKWCQMFHCQQTIIGERSNIIFSCDALVTGGQSAIALSPEDIAKWSSEEILNCLDVLGSIDWSIDIRRKVWKIIQESVDLTNNDVLLDLGKLIQVAVEDQYNELNLTNASNEVLSLIGSFTYNIDTLQALAIYVKDKIPLAKQNNRLELLKASSLHLLCGLDIETLDELFPSPNNTESLNQYSILGLLSECPSETVRIHLAEKFLSLYDGHFSPSDIASMGLFVSGLPNSILNNLTTESIEVISSSALRYFSNHQLSTIGEALIDSMSVQAFTVIKNQQHDTVLEKDLSQFHYVFSKYNSQEYTSTAVSSVTFSFFTFLDLIFVYVYFM